MGILIQTETVMLLCCIIVSLLYKEDDLNSFIFVATITAITGSALLFIGRDAKNQLSKRDGIIIVSIAWIVASIFGMLPFYLSGYVPDITNAFFETISGFTSTGASILDDIESLPHGLLFWRSMTQWIGGLGIIFFTIAVLPTFGGSGGMRLFAAEASTLSPGKIHPRIGVTAKWIWSIYLGMTIILVPLLKAGGMNTFDSICHAFTTTGTGGFSTKQASIAHYNSAYIEYVIATSMIIAGINYTLLLMMVTGKFKKLFNNTELKWYLTSVVCFTLFATIGLCLTNYADLEEAFRMAYFQVATLHTSTAFTASDYMSWHPVIWGTLSILLIIGACTGSTSGGIKCIRVAIFTKIARNEFKRIIHPNAILPIRVNKQVTPQHVVTSLQAFLFVFLIVVFISCIILMALGVGFTESLGTVLSSISNLGFELRFNGPAYTWNSLPNPAKWLSAFLMLLGRLELFTMLIIFTRGFWKKG